MHRRLFLVPVVGIVSLLAACAADRLATTVEEDVLAIHWVTTEIASDVRMCEVLGSDEEIAIETEPLFTLAAFDSAAVERLSDDNFSVSVFLSDRTRQELLRITSENVGRRMAILVDGVAHSMPMIMQPADLESLPVGYYQEGAFAEELAAHLNRMMMP